MSKYTYLDRDAVALIRETVQQVLFEGDHSVNLPPKFRPRKEIALAEGAISAGSTSAAALASVTLIDIGSGGALSRSGDTVTCYNYSDSEIAAGSYYPIVRDFRSGKWQAIILPSASTGSTSAGSTQERPICYIAHNPTAMSWSKASNSATTNMIIFNSQSIDIETDTHGFAMNYNTTTGKFTFTSSTTWYRIDYGVTFARNGGAADPNDTAFFNLYLYRNLIPLANPVGKCWTKYYSTDHSWNSLHITHILQPASTDIYNLGVSCVATAPSTESWTLGPPGYISWMPIRTGDST